MFYLDAHWYDYMPLPDEIRIIAEQCERAIIVVDDVFVESDPRFGYDEYANLRIDLNVIHGTLTAYRDDALIYLPAYDPTREPSGGARGMAVILLGQEKQIPTHIFPFNLLVDTCQLKSVSE